MSRASKERERIERRAVYQKRQDHASQPDAYERATNAATAEERRMELESRERLKGLDTAVHEAGHAVAAWLQGVKIGRMFFNDRGTSYHDKALDHLVAMTTTGEPLTKSEISSNRSALAGTAEGFVLGCKHAFIALAGPLATLLYLNDGDQPVTMKAHFSEAMSLLNFYGGLDKQALRAEGPRIFYAVNRAFEDERIRSVTVALADKFFTLRFMSGEQVLNTIEETWASAQDEHKKKAMTAKAGE
jgi:hypothetical protein